MALEKPGETPLPDAKHERAARMRSAGVSYAKIAAEVGANETTVKNWFSKSADTPAPLAIQQRCRVLAAAAPKRVNLDLESLLCSHASIRDEARAAGQFKAAADTNRYLIEKVLQNSDLGKVIDTEGEDVSEPDPDSLMAFLGGDDGDDPE